ncbi:MAG: protein phosphatase 2C domain-containing protein [Actinomycetota bacterium]|nr:protein phosphatase 2C domain-containing protein [Actinomycetota bacterium]
MSKRTTGVKAHAPEWWACGASVQGVNHLRTGSPNEDAAAWRTARDGRWGAACVADGHGHALAVRAAEGARLAVSVAVQLASGIGDELSSGDVATSRVEDELAELPARLVAAWAQAIERRMEEAPLTKAELDGLGSERQALDRHPLVAHGTTLLLAIAGGGLTLVSQIGDGEVLSVDEAGTVARPVPGDSRLVGSNTTSLASPSAVGEFRSALLGADGNSPALIVLATDGYVNSFAVEAGFLAVGRDLLLLLREAGPESVARSLPEWLETTSRDGSGDDASMALLVDRRRSAVQGR